MGVVLMWKFLRALHPKWRAKVMVIEESKDLSSLALDELIGNLKVHEVVMEKESEIYKGKKERVKPIALKAKKESSDDETSTSRSDNEEYAMAECKKPKWVKEYTYHKENMLLCKQAEKGVPHQAEQSDWLEDMDEGVDDQELEAHYSYMAKI
nr:UBN2 domain-containing protein [Tanacetum cinerariifolium]